MGQMGPAVQPFMGIPASTPCHKITLKNLFETKTKKKDVSDALHLFTFKIVISVISKTSIAHHHRSSSVA
jgi:hypothetical protein